ncbi:hypothetical protein HPB50_026692 [Hyalomma asiaticum]|uniref:Uncharacterized protein n=1 Tax=Hyalomma asiaticum TaxID=266040 RepID=A0ACB7TRT5_HYAAI|nr:hypothetical protein HPB50_026692 [Hyalomma asiaticum]
MRMCDGPPLKAPTSPRQRYRDRPPGPLLVNAALQNQKVGVAALACIFATPLRDQQQCQHGEVSPCPDMRMRTLLGVLSAEGCLNLVTLNATTHATPLFPCDICNHGTANLVSQPFSRLPLLPRHSASSGAEDYAHELRGATPFREPIKRNPFDDSVTGHGGTETRWIAHNPVLLAVQLLGVLSAEGCLKGP